MIRLVENLSEHQDVQGEDDEDHVEPAKSGRSKSEEPRTIISAGGRGDLDDAAAVIIGDILERGDFEVRDITHDELEAVNIGKLDLADASAI
ncbi:hypothetical protein NY486_00465, partial [Enterobacter hormaechei]|nr:hypothetical protein [Enterobacter hormaechei]